MSAARSAVVDPARRALLRGRVRARDVMRPPWARVEAEFLERCTRCALCVEACPEGILRRGDGGFPEVAFDGGECTFCGECVAACEPRALDATISPPWSWSARLEGECLAQQGIVCQSCREACPTQAIRFAPTAVVAPPLIDAELCSGCGACLGVCPVSALGMTTDAERA